MLLDKVSEPKTFYYEDKEGNDIPFDWSQGFPEGKWHRQHSKYALVQHSVCIGNRSKNKDLWPVKFVKWLLDVLPERWKKPEISFSMNSTINGNYPIIKYLVEQRNFSFNDACVISSELCERCLNLVLCDLNEQTYNAAYFNSSRTYCSYCEDLDPYHATKYRLWCCYRSYKYGGDINWAYNEVSVDAPKLHVKRVK